MSRQTTFRSILSGASSFLMIMLLGLTVTTSARAGDLSASVSCPAQATSGSQLEVQLEIQNGEDEALDARILSSFVGNSGDNLAGIGVFGPSVAVQSVMLPAATPSGPYYSEPSVTNIMFNAAPSVPSSLAGTVATLLIVVETSKLDGSRSVGDVTECLVEVQ